MAELIVGHFYKFNDRGEIHVGQYAGKDQGFECVVCGLGHKAATFNLWYDNSGGYETWGFGKSHMPEILEDLGKDSIILDNVN